MKRRYLVIIKAIIKIMGPDDSDSKESACNAGDQASISGWGRSPGEGNGNPYQYSCLECYMDRGVYGVTKSWTRLND